jgi:hypothetical protein
MPLKLSYWPNNSASHGVIKEIQGVGGIINVGVRRGTILACPAGRTVRGLGKN